MDRRDDWSCWESFIIFLWGLKFWGFEDTWQACPQKGLWFFFFSNSYRKDSSTNKKMSVAIFPDTIYFNPLNEKGENVSVNELTCSMSFNRSKENEAIETTCQETLDDNIPRWQPVHACILLECSLSMLFCSKKFFHDFN